MQATGTVEIIFDREPTQYDLARSKRRLKDGRIKKSEQQTYIVESFVAIDSGSRHSRWMKRRSALHDGYWRLAEVVEDFEFRSEGTKRWIRSATSANESGSTPAAVAT